MLTPPSAPPPRNPNSGTYIEHKGSALVWHFRDTHPEFGAMQAKEMVYNLQATLAQYPLEVMRGPDYVEVRPQGVNKGVAVDKIVSALERRAGAKPHDFIMCIGDDQSDETMFNALQVSREAACLRDAARPSDH